MGKLMLLVDNSEDSETASRLLKSLNVPLEQASFEVDEGKPPILFTPEAIRGFEGLYLITLYVVSAYGN